MIRLFMTGTDTEIGKTWASCVLARKLVAQGRKVAVMKPIASGCASTPDGLRSEDALALVEASGDTRAYGEINPYAYEPAIAPHIAAQQVGRFPEIGHISSIADRVEADVLLIEGVGGWLVPIDGTSLLPELVRSLKADVILVVGLRLGCINHALLSARQVVNDGFRLRGWIANQIDPGMAFQPENMTTLTNLLGVPMICSIPWGSKTGVSWSETVSIT